MKRTASPWIVLLLFQCGLVQADTAPENPVENVFEFPKIAPEIRFWGGYILVDDHDKAGATTYESFRPAPTGSTKAGEYHDLDGSLAGGLFYKAFPFPHRVHLEADAYGENDYHADLRHSYKDIFIWRLQPRRFYHNLDNITLVDFDPSSAYISLDRRDIGREYGVRFDNNRFYMRLKTPDYPLHFYMSGESSEKKGERQLRFIGGHGYFEGVRRISKSQDVDQKVRSYSVASNGHFGPVEIEISHSDKRFDSDARNDSHYAYERATYGGPMVREAGAYPHSLVPELKASTNTLKVHTSHTGKVYASMTFSRIDKENVSSSAEADHFMGFGDFFWQPRTDLTFGAKYRHQENDGSAPGSVTVVDRTNPANTYRAFNIHPGVKGTSDETSVTVRYVPLPRFTVKGQFHKQWKEIEDQSAIDWHRAVETTYDTYELDMSWRAPRKVKVAGRYVHKDTKHHVGTGTAILNEPDHSDQGIVSVTWTPTVKVSAHLNMNITKERADNFRSVDFDFTPPRDIKGADEYESLRERYLGSLTYMFSEKVSTTASYAYMVTKTDQDLAYGSYPTPAAFVDEDYSHEMEAHVVGLNANCKPAERLSMNFSLDYTLGKGDFLPTVTEALTPVSIGIFSHTRNNKITAGIDGEYELENGWGTGVEMRYGRWDDDSFDNPAKGSFFASLLKVTRKF